MKKSPHKKKQVKHTKRTGKYHEKIKIDASFEEVIKMAAQGGFVSKKK